jgi:multidrug efflux pump subunit AcrA (membrane-fusion protein)
VLKIRGWAGPVFLLVVLGTGSCTSELNTPVEPEPLGSPKTLDQILLDPEAFELAGIELVETQVASLPEILKVAGRVGLNENRVARVGSVVSGRISEVYANVGDKVREGQRLAQIQSHEVDDARAQYAKGKADLERAQSELEYATQVRDRASRLLDLKAGSLEELQRAETEVHRAEMDILVSRAEMGRWEELLEHMGVSVEGALEEYGRSGEAHSAPFDELERIPVNSPLTGTVLERLITPGTVVSTSDDLFILGDLSTLWVHAEVPESYLNSLRRGQTAIVRVEAYPDIDFPARLTYIGDVLNPATRTVQVRCETNNPGEKLRSEMYATVTFELGLGEESVVVPQEAIQDIDGEKVLFVQTGKNQFEPRNVTTGFSWNDQIAISEGLQPSEKVVTRGSFLLKSEMLKSRMQEE